MVNQTALEWFLARVRTTSYDKMNELIDQAKKLEKDQIIQAFDTACEDKDRIGEEYYNETYNVQFFTQ